MKPGIDYIGVGVGAAILNEDGKLLIARRSLAAKNERGKWEIPGGAVEFGETFAQALKREVKEELDVEIDLLELLGICDHLLPEERQHWVSPTYLCRIVSGNPRIVEPHKCDEIGWFTLADAATLPLSVVTQYDIDLLRKRV